MRNLWGSSIHCDGGSFGRVTWAPESPQVLTGFIYLAEQRTEVTVRVLVLGSGVIGSVYAGRLLLAGHDVVLLARGRRLSDLQTQGLVLEEATGSVPRIVLPVRCVSEPDESGRFDLVLVAVRGEQVTSTLPVLSAMTDGSDVLFFGNTAGCGSEIVAALGDRALFGFPAVGGVRDGPVVRYVLITQQKTMLGEASGVITSRAQRLRTVMSGAGFPTSISAHVGDWLVGHAAFVVPIAYALFRVGVDPARLAADPQALRLMVCATRQSFTALRKAGNAEIPRNLRALYRLPTICVVWYWRRVFSSPRGELWFAAHSRAAPQEMRSLARVVQTELLSTGQPTPDLDRLLAAP
jgi:2-dehydropantoate 2-reductase